VRIRRVEVRGFGCLGRFECDLAPGLHLFWGRNEAGKSTLQRAMLALLYGFYEGDRALAHENRAREQDAPWAGGAYGGTLEYELENGDRFRVDRDFASPDVPTRIWDVITGEEVTYRFGKGRHGNVPFMQQHLGMPKRIFEACALVSHGDLFAALAAEPKNRADRAREIGETIVRLADTAGRDVSAQAALSRLEKTFDERVGGPRARAKPLAVARAALKRAEEEREEIVDARQAVAGEARQLEERERERSHKEEELRRVRYLLLVAERRGLLDRVSQLEKLDQEQEEQRQRERELAPWANFPEEQRDEVQRQWTRIQGARQRLEQRRGEIAEAEKRIGELEAERDALALEEQGLAYLRSFPSEREGQIRQLEAQWRAARGICEEARRRLDAVAPQAAPVLEEYGRLETEIGWLTADDAGRLVALVQARRAGVISSAIKVLGRALAWLWRLLRAAARWLIGRIVRRRAEAGPPQTPAAGDGGAPRLANVTPAEAATLLQLWQRYQEVAPAVRSYREADAAVAEAAERLEGVERDLRAALEGAVPGLADLEVALAEFWRRADQRRQLESLSAEREKRDQEIGALRKDVAAYEAELSTLAGWESALDSLLRQALGRQGDMEALVQEFEDGWRKKRDYSEVQRRLSQIERERGHLLSGRSPAELRRMLEERERAIREAEAEAPWLQGASTSEDEEQLKAHVQRLDGELKALEREIVTLKTTIDTTLKGLRPLSEVEEAVERNRRDVEGLEAFGAALNAAVDVIKEAMKKVHRDFAPHVGQFLGDGLARVTSGRYREALVDPSTFDVSVKAPEDGQIRRVEALSRGTQAAAYLLLRAGLAQHMSNLKEPVPLILDDPLVDLDDVRLENFLDLLLGLSEKMQVLLFTKDEETRRWLEKRAATDQRCRVTCLDRAAAGATSTS